MRCSVCGHDNAAGARFCTSCGNPLASGAVATVEYVAPPEPPRTPSVNGTARPARKATRFVAGGVAAIIILGAGGFGLHWLSQAHQETSYVNGVVAVDDQRWDVAVPALQAAGDYLDAKKQLEAASPHLGVLIRYYDTGKQSAASGDWWQAAYDLRRASETQAHYRDTDTRLAAARGHIGSLLYTTGGSGSETLWLAPADGGDPHDLLAGAAVHTSLSDSGGPFLAVVGAGQQQTAYVFSADGQTRRQVAQGNMGDVRVGTNHNALLVVAAAAGPTELLVNLNTGDQRQVVQAPAQLVDVTPDLGKAALLTPNGDSSMLSIMDLGTGAQQDLASFPGSPRVILAPDGQRALVLTSDRDDQGRSRVTATLVDVSSGGKLDLGAGQGANGDFSPDGQQLVLWQQPFDRTEGTLTLVHVLSGQRTTVSDAADPLRYTLWTRPVKAPAATPAANATPTPSAGLQALLVMGNPAGGQSRWSAMLLDAATGKAAPVASGAQGFDPTYSPAVNRFLIFARPAGQATGAVTLLDPATGDRRVLTSASDATGLFSPDGKRLALVVTDTSRPLGQQVRVLTAVTDGGQLTPVYSGPSQLPVQFSPDGSKLAYSLSGAGPTDSGLFVSSLDGRAAVPVLTSGTLQAWRTVPLPTAAQQ